MDKNRLEEIIKNFSGKRIAVIGDLMLDAYIWGEVSRISPEAPVPVVHVKDRSFSLGGAANVMRNIISLGANVSAFGTVGNKENGIKLLSLMKDEQINTDNIILDSNYITIEKQRVIAESQHLARVDFEDKDSISFEVKKQISELLIDKLNNNQIDAVILEDYGKGLLDSEMLQPILEKANKNGIPVALDPHPSHKLDLKGLTLMTPNHSEAYSLAGIFTESYKEPASLNKSLPEVAKKLTQQYDLKYLLVTLGPNGMALFQNGENITNISTKAQEVFDVTGAGDTVIAVSLLALLGGATFKEAAEIANYAASIVVGRIGTSSTNGNEIIEKFT